MNIKWQILTRVGAILVSCLLIVSMVVTIIFIKQGEENVLEERNTQVLQAAQQIDSMINEIQVFANNMIIDPSVQRALFGSSGKQMSQGEAFYLAVEQLKNFKALRDDIHSIALVTKDNQIVWETKLSDGDYFKELMRQEWYQEIGKTSHAQFSTIHEVADANGHRSKTLSYIVPVYNMQQYQKAKGYIIINLFPDKFENLLQVLEPSYHQITWSQGGRTILTKRFTKNAENNSNFIEQKYKETDLCAYAKNSSISIINPSLMAEFLVILALLVAGLLIMVPTIKYIVEPLKTLSDFMDDTKANYNPLSQIVVPPVSKKHTAKEIIVLNQTFSNLLQELHEQTERRVEYEKKMQQLRTEMILSQVKPHFLYNTLNSISIMARQKNAKNIEDITQSLITLLQKSIVYEDQEMVCTLGEEIEMLKEYTTIQQYRYQDKFSVDIDISDDLLSYPVPRFILQPIVENSIFHGITPKAGQGTIWISAAITEEHFVLLVDDDGIGMEEENIVSALDNPSDEKLQLTVKGSIGLKNLKERLEIIYGEKAQIVIHTQPGVGFSVEIQIPYTEN